MSDFDRNIAAARAGYGADQLADPTADLRGLGADVAFEVAGNDDAVRLAMESVRPGGRVVLAGRLSELRAGALRRRLEVTLGRDAGERWWERWSEALPGVLVAGGDGRSVRLTVDRSVDLEKVLTEARSAAEVVRFDFDPPSLSEIFREAVRS